MSFLSLQNREKLTGTGGSFGVTPGLPMEAIFGGFRRRLLADPLLQLPRNASLLSISRLVQAGPAALIGSFSLLTGSSTGREGDDSLLANPKVEKSPLSAIMRALHAQTLYDEMSLFTLGSDYQAERFRVKDRVKGSGIEVKNGTLSLATDLDLVRDVISPMFKRWLKDAPAEDLTGVLSVLGRFLFGEATAFSSGSFFRAATPKDLTEADLGNLAFYHYDATPKGDELLLTLFQDDAMLAIWQNMSTLFAEKRMSDSALSAVGADKPDPVTLGQARYEYSYNLGLVLALLPALQLDAWLRALMAHPLISMALQRSAVAAGRENILDDTTTKANTLLDGFVLPTTADLISAVTPRSIDVPSFGSAVSHIASYMPKSLVEEFLTSAGANIDTLSSSLRRRLMITIDLVLKGLDFSFLVSGRTPKVTSSYAGMFNVLFANRARLISIFERTGPFSPSVMAGHVRPSLKLQSFTASQKATWSMPLADDTIIVTDGVRTGVDTPVRGWLHFATADLAKPVEIAAAPAIVTTTTGYLFKGPGIVAIPSAWLAARYSGDPDARDPRSWVLVPDAATADSVRTLGDDVLIMPNTVGAWSAHMALVEADLVAQIVANEADWAHLATIDTKAKTVAWKEGLVVTSSLQRALGRSAVLEWKPSNDKTLQYVVFDTTGTPSSARKAMERAGVVDRRTSAPKPMIGSRLDAVPMA